MKYEKIWMSPAHKNKGQSMPTSQSCTLAKSKQLFPGISFFSNNDKKLVIPLDKIVDRITLEIITQKGGFFGINDISPIGLCDSRVDPLNYRLELDLEKVIFRNKNGREKYTKDKQKLERKKKELAQRFMHKVFNEKSGILLEPSSIFKLHLVFNEPTFLSKINLGAPEFQRILRSDQDLIITTSCKDIASVAYSSKAEENYLKALDSAMKIFNISIDKLKQSSSAFDVFSLALMDKIQAKDIDSIDNLFLHRCLPLYESEPDLNNYQSLALATILFKINLTLKWRATKKYSFYRKLLWHDNIIHKVMSKYNEIHEAFHEKKDNFVLSKHSMQASRLLTLKNQYLKAMQHIITAAEKADVEIIICYGTLLGAVRNQSFLAHDDDVDLLVMYRNTKSREDAIKKEHLLCNHLEAQGIKIRRKGKGIGFHARDPVNKVQLDMFACWEPEEGQTMLMMEHFDYRTVPTNILRPPSQVHLHGMNFPAPSNPEAFLQERYGNTWEKPDPYHEFPWPVQMD